MGLRKLTGAFNTKSLPDKVSAAACASMCRSMSAFWMPGRRPLGNMLSARTFMAMRQGRFGPNCARNSISLPLSESAANVRACSSARCAPAAWENAPRSILAAASPSPSPEFACPATIDTDPASSRVAAKGREENSASGTQLGTALATERGIKRAVPAVLAVVTGKLSDPSQSRPLRLPNSKRIEVC